MANHFTLNPMQVCLLYNQINVPIAFRKHYETVSSLLFATAVCILALGPLSLSVVSYGVTFMFVVIVLQQLFDRAEEPPVEVNVAPQNPPEENENAQKENVTEQDNKSEPNTSDSEEKTSEHSEGVNAESSSENCDVCSESRIYTIFKNFREKFTFNEDL